jgi:small redox-active disulfide protein 2
LINSIASTWRIDKKEQLMKIEVLSTGGTFCKTLFSNALEALRESGRTGRVVIVKDIRKIMRYGVIATPALVINGVVMFSGRIGSPEEIIALLHRNLSTFV